MDANLSKERDDFLAINLRDLDRAAIVPQVLDNQWVPRQQLSQILQEKKSLSGTLEDRRESILSEWRRALTYGRQVVVNRAYLFNNPVVAMDYQSLASRSAFKSLLNQQVIVPYLFTEDNPGQKPTFDVLPNLWQAWTEVVAETKMACVRLSWGDQSLDIKNLAQTFHQYIQSLNLDDRVQHLVSEFNIAENSREAFRQRLIDVARFAFDVGSQGKYITRNQLYKEFLCVEDSDIAKGIYDPDKPFVSELKQIFDLKYNVNLPDALGRYALTPKDSPPRTALGDLQQALLAPITDKNLEEILYAIQRMVFASIAEGMYLEGLHHLSLDDVIEVRSTDEWGAFAESVGKLVENPLNFADAGPDVYKNFVPLNRKLTKIKVQARTARWEPVVKFLLFIGGKALTIAVNPVNPAEKLLTAGGGYVATGMAPLVMRLVVTGLTKWDADLAVSLDFMRSSVQNGRDTWDEIFKKLSETPGFKLIEKSLGQESTPNQSQPEETLG